MIIIRFQTIPLPVEIILVCDREKDFYVYLKHAFLPVFLPFLKLLKIINHLLLKDMRKSILLLFLISVFPGVAQEIDREPNYALSVISSRDNTGVGIYCADSFYLGDLMFSPLELIFYGTRRQTALMAPLVQNLNVIFYQTEDNLPLGHPDFVGTCYAELLAIELQHVEIIEEAFKTTFIINLESLLGWNSIGFPPNEILWVTVFPTLSEGTWDSTGWFWAASDQYADYPPAIIDPTDDFGMGITSWTPLQNVTATSPNSFAWRMTGIHGEDPGATEDFVKVGGKVFPIPFVDQFTLIVPDHINLKMVEIKDLSGRAIPVECRERTVFTSHLSPGMYILYLKTEQGDFTRKVLKQ